MFGPFLEKDLRVGLADGRFEPGDFVQVDGRVVWQPLGRVLEATEAELKGAVAPDWSTILKWAWLRLRYNLDEQSLRTGGVCLLIGTLSLALSHWEFVFWLPWFLAAAVAGLSLLRRKHEGHGALLLAAVIVLPLLFLIFGPKRTQNTLPPIALNAPSSTAPAEPATPAPKVAPAPVAAATPAPIAAAPVPAAPAPTPALPAMAAEPVPGLPPTPVPVPTTSANPVAVRSPLAGPVIPNVPSARPAHNSPPAAVAPATPAPVAASATPARTPSDAGSLLSTANKIAGTLLPFLSGAKSSLTVPSLPSFDLGGSGKEDEDAEIRALEGHNDAFVIIKGSNLSGSGFLCRAWNKTWLFSNIHVVAEIKQPSIMRMDNVAVIPGPGEVAAGPDIARLILPKPPEHPLELMTDFDTNVHIGDGVVVMGNSGGGGVVTSLKGKILGIGPDRLEVSAEFIPGNSGSPIIHLKTGKVIGIATYLTKRYEEFGGGNGQPAGNGGVVVRRFGYRIDTVANWEPANWVELGQEAEAMDQISKLTADIYDFVTALNEDRTPQFATDTLRRPAQEWLTAINARHNSPRDRRSATEGFLNALRFMVRGDVAMAEGRVRYTYFRDRLKKEEAIRDRMYKAFDTAQAKYMTPLDKAYR
jgi:hypothetical protein